ncbi:hyaluronidase-5-like [Engraulis encrasicolus]|uniref:hyaluronidase-5-like n=1 Tax=Engraulis encrasicolus TaxID=184585 RepID=UPI002FCF682D
MRSPHLLLPTTLCLLLFSLKGLSLTPTLPPTTAAPLLPDKPFVVIWNAPTHKCRQTVPPLDMSAMQADTTPAAKPDQFLTLFYKHRVGSYPYLDLKSLGEVNGGLPQKGNLTAHLAKARTDITMYVPEQSPGLAVIDWEEWLPLFDRNLDEKELYRNLSVDHTLKSKPWLKPGEAVAEARREFRRAARGFMEETLRAGISERPGYLWGFYLFPDCYNYRHNTSEPLGGYTGECSEATRLLNDKLLWLWNASTALYPSAYLWSELAGDPKAALFVRNQVREALRVSALPQQPHTSPVYVYSRPVFGDQNKVYLSEVDLIRSVGESAALGAAGAVMWGASADFNSKETCEALSAYLHTTLNPYIANVTGAAKLCSTMLCEGKGRCVRKNSDSDDYLHLNPNSFRIEKKDGRYQSAGVPDMGDLTALAEQFTCQCYAGQSCSPKRTFRIPKAEMVFQV